MSLNIYIDVHYRIFCLQNNKIEIDNTHTRIKQGAHGQLWHKNRSCQRHIHSAYEANGQGNCGLQLTEVACVSGWRHGTLL